MRIIPSIFFLTALLYLSGCATKQDPEPTYLKAPFQAVSIAQATLVQKGTQKKSCVICGMHLPSFYKTNHAATTKENKVRQYCSLHCVVHDNEINKTNLYDVKVVDVTTLKFVTAQSAYYVVGSTMPGTMTRFSKYAFAKRSDADAFVKQYGGHVMNFYDAYTVSMQDFIER